MVNRRKLNRLSFAAMAGLAIVAMTTIAGCGMMGQSSSLVAMTTQLRGANEVPPNASPASGSVDAMFDKDTNLLRWKVNYAGLSGAPTAGHFHGPAAAGTNAGVVLGWLNPLSNGMQGSATLSAAQANDLMAGRWYANVHTAAYPAGEVRGQMTVRN